MLALSGFGVWSLVWQSVIQSLIKCIMIFTLYGWLPRLTFDYNSIKETRKFSSKIMYASFLGVLSENLYTFIIGKYYSKSDLGFYTQAKKLYEIPVMTINGIVQNVSYPLLSNLKNMGEDLLHYYITNIGLVSFISVPVMIYLFVSADQIIYFLLGEKWMESVIYLRILSLVGLTYNATLVNNNAFKVSNRMDVALKLVALQQGLRIGAIIISSNFGVIAIAISEFISSFVNYLLTISKSSNLIGYPFVAQVYDLLKKVLICIPSILIYVVLDSSLKANLSVFILNTFLFFVFYILMAKKFSKKELTLIQDFLLFSYRKLSNR